MFKLTPRRRGQVTILDIILIPVLAIVLSVVSAFFITNTTANITNMVALEPLSESCNLAIDNIFSQYYVHTQATLKYLQEFHPNQYSAATAEAFQEQVANCGSSCQIGFTTIPTSLTSSGSIYVNFINYFASFSLSVFNLTTADDRLELSTLGMSVYMNQIPSGFPATTVCSLPVYNPQNPSEPYTVYGTVS